MTNLEPGTLNPEPSRLFGEDFLRRLERLRLSLVRAAGSRAEGLRLSGPRGSSGEFRQHRDYVPGDEERYIDWNLYGRLEKLFLKEFTPDREGRALVLLDCSASMGTASGKFDFARRLAAALGYVALAGGDRLTAVAFGAESARAATPKPAAAGLYELLDFLERLTPAGPTGYRTAAARAAETGHVQGRGAAAWISDFWTGPAAWTDLAAPASRGYDGALLRVMSPEEVAPEPGGSRILVDSETGEKLRLSGGAEAGAIYEQAAAAHAAELSNFAARNRLRLVTASSAEPFEEAAMKLLAGSGLIER
jgi:uncharacterized protein (DUF58 family)